MSKAKITWLIIATSLVLIGAILFAGVMTVYHWDFNKLSTIEFETSTCQIDKDFSDIDIDTDTADVVLAASDDGTCSVISYLPEQETCEASVKDDALVIKISDNRSWIERFGISFEKPKITVYLPKERYGTLSIGVSTGNVTISDAFSFESIEVSGSTGDVSCSASADEAIKIDVSTGNIRVKDLAAGEVDLETSTGSIRVDSVAVRNDLTADVSTGGVDLSDITCSNLYSDGDTGSISLDDVIVEHSLNIERDTGSVSLDDCDAGEIYIMTDTGDVRGTLLSDKVFFTETDTGKVNVPKTITGGRCEITTDTGDITFRIKS